MASGGSSRVMKKLESCLEQGQFYEAHQMYRTLYFRLTNQGDTTKTLQLLHDGVLQLLKYNQYSSAADLAFLYVQTLDQQGTGVSSAILEQIEHIFTRLTPEKHDGESAEDRHKFVCNTLNWSKKVAPTECDYKKRGHPGLHLIFATTYWDEQQHAQARYHILLSDQPQKSACFLIEYHLRWGLAGEVDLFVAQAVMQLLCYAKKTQAQTVFDSYTNDHPQIDQGPPFTLPLLNFLWLLLLCVDLRKLEYFSVLVEQYQPSIKRDATYNSYLDKIGQLFFGLPPPPKKQQQGGIFGNLLQGLFDEGESEDEYVPVENGLVTSENGPVTGNITEDALD